MAKPVNVAAVVKRSEKAIVLFTRGGNTKLSHLGTSSTGDWKVHEDREFNKVVIYHRDDAAGTNTVFKGDYVRRSPGKQDGKIKIHMDNVKNLGTTDANWKEFCANDGSANPIMYFSK